MDSETLEIIKTVSSEAIKTIGPEVYGDIAKPATKETGSFLAILPRALNAALVDVEIWIEKRKFKLEKTKQILAKKLKETPVGDIVPPDMHIAVPALQAISYSMDSEELREMYANLLAGSMNKNLKKSVLPSFVDIIKNLSPDEAKILKRLFKIEVLPTVSAGYKKKDSRGEVMIIEWFSTIAEEVSAEEPDNVVAYLDNLVRLGLLQRLPDKWLTKESLYDKLEKHPKILQIAQNKAILQLGEFKLKKEMMKLTEFGRRFCEICIEKDANDLLEMPPAGYVVISPTGKILFDSNAKT